MSTSSTAVVLLALVLTACGPTGGGPDGEITALAVEPADPVVVSIDGSQPTVQFQVRATYADGTDAILDDAAWTLEPAAALGSLGVDDGAFVASGAQAGVATVRAELADASATTTVTVRIEDELVADGVSPDGPDRFTDPTSGAAGAPALLYPLDQALMPSSVKPPHVQWEVAGAAPDDLYRVVATAGLARITAYLADDGTFAWPVDPARWSVLEKSAGAQPISFVVDRWSSATGQTLRSATIGVRVVAAQIDGAIYYWDLSGGRMLRITGDGREDFMPAPPARPADGARCVACHTVSRDGRLLAAGLWDASDFNAIFDLGADLAADPAPTVVPPDRYRALSSSFNPDASRLIVNDGLRLGLIDAATGAELTPAGTPLPTTGAGHPTWSPDGSLIAYVNHDGTGWGVDFTTADLAVIPVTGPDAFGPPQTLRAAEGLASTWPTFGPDSEWIAFGRGTNSRGKSGATSYPGTLHMIHRSGGASVELARAGGGQLASYLPNFSPFDEGGYFWLAFYSTRDYGNAEVGTRGTTRRQLWITAIAKDAPPGADPSQVPYWLPDQDVATDNMSSYWAPAPPIE